MRTSLPLCVAATHVVAMAPHPYLPASADIPHYVPNDISVVTILGVFFGAVLVVLLVCAIVTSKYNVTGSDRMAFLWFVCSGLIHGILETYFGWNNRTLAGGSSFLDQLWKEYSLGDSRYVLSDPFVVSMESFTGFVEGPVCLLVAYAIVARAPWRFSIQGLVSFGQLYGCILYYATEVLDKDAHGPFNHPLYFWFYYIFMNAIWIVIPTIMIVQSVRRSTQAFSKLKQQ